MGGDCCFDAFDGDIAQVGEEELAGDVGRADALLAEFPSNRDGVRWLLDTAEVPALGHARFDPGSGLFTAGSLTLAENLIPFIAFLALVRGAGEFVAPRGSGIAFVHNVLWGGDEDLTTLAAVVIGPDGTSRFAPPDERDAIASSLQPWVDDILGPVRALDDDPSGLPPLADDLDDLR